MRAPPHLGVHDASVKKSVLTILGLSLLLASCNQPQVVDPNADDKTPFIPRTVSGPVTCPDGTQGSARGVAGLLGADQKDRGNLVTLSALRQQTDLLGTVQDMLYASKSIINPLYFGYSTVDLQKLHDTTYTTFKQTYPKHLGTYYVDDTTDALMDEYINAIQDGHTYYMDAQIWKLSNDSSSNAPQAIPTFGLRQTTIPGQDGLLVVNVRAEGAAFAAGLRRGDVILSVDGQALTRTIPAQVGADGSVNDSAQMAAFGKVISAAAAKQAPVTFVVRRGAAQRTATLQASVLNGMEYPWGEIRNDATGRSFYYLRVPTFMGQGVAARVHELVAEARAQGVSGLVVDLRSNGGGLLTEFVGAVGAFVPDKATQQVRYVDGTSTTFRYNAGKVYYNYSCSAPQAISAVPAASLWTGKVAVLLNGGSASASEMFSQNIKLGGQATLIGEETYGVGDTSTFHLELPGERGISVTAGRVSVGGQASTQFVTPDIAVRDDLAALAASGTDAALQTAFTELLK